MATNAGEAVNVACAAIDFGALGSRGSLVLPGPPLVPDVPVGDPSTPARYITAPSAFCDEWMAMVNQYADATRQWREGHDPNVSAAYWSPA